MALDVTISGPKTNSYISLEDARERLNGFPPPIQDTWDEASDDKNFEYLLRRATTLIDQFTGWGPPKVKTQIRSFPRAVDSPTAIPERVLSALVEFIAFSLDGSMIGIKKLQEEGVENASILGQSQSYAEERSGLPAGSRRELEHLKVGDWGGTPLHRDVPGLTQPGQDSQGIFYGGPG